MQVWNVLHAARWNTSRKKSPKIRHLPTVAQICRAISSQLRHVSTIEKKLLNSNISSTCSHNIVNFGPLAAEIGLPVWGTQQFSTGFACWLRYCTDVAQRRSTKLCMMFGRLLDWYTVWIMHFWHSCPLTDFCKVQNLLCVQVLRSPILAALLHGSRVVGDSQTLRRWAKGAPIFGKAAISLGIGPHFSSSIK